MLIPLRIAFGMDLDDFCLTATQDLRQPAGSIAPHVINDHFEPSLFDRFDVDQIV